MTTLADDADALIAGVSRRAAKAVYAFEAPGGAQASAIRRHGGGHVTVTLTLTPEAAARAKAAGGSEASVVVIDPPARYVAESSWPRDPRAVSLRGLLLDRALLSHPDWLADAKAAPDDLTDDERWLLHAMRVTLATQLSAVAGEAPVECKGCHELRTAGYRRELADIEQTVVTRTQNGRRLNAQQAYELSRRLWEFRSKGPPPLTQTCPHIALMAAAPAALVAAHPEFAFELAGLLDVSTEGKRFVLGQVFATALLPLWLTGRARDGGWYGYTRRYRPRRTSPWTSIRDRARAAQELPKEQRAAVTYAAAAWGLGASLEAIGWTPPAEPVAPPKLRADADEAPLEVAAQVPPFAVKRPPPKPAPAKAEKTAVQVAAAETVAAKAAKKPATEKPRAEKPKAEKGAAKKPKAEKAPKPPAALRAVTRDVLRAVGITDALLDEMVREGRLIKVGDDQYAHPAEAKKPKR